MYIDKYDMEFLNYTKVKSKSNYFYINYNTILIKHLKDNSNILILNFCKDFKTSIILLIQKLNSIDYVFLVIIYSRESINNV